MAPPNLSSSVREAARGLGFSAVGLASVERLREGDALRSWIARGFHAGMRWMENPETREDPSRLLPGARTAVVVGTCSRLPDPGAVSRDGGAQGRIASFGRFRDYHRVMGRKLKELLAIVQGLVPCHGIVAVDSRPVLERALAHRAGLGWFGKNASLISPEFGPWLLLGAVVVDAEMETDVPMEPRCGDCQRCLEACPSGALVSPGVVDARKCVSYLTIEGRDAVPPESRRAVGNRIFGCDECLRACPWGAESVPARFMEPRLPAFMPADEFPGMEGEAFLARFAGTPLMRAGREKMARNAETVLANHISHPGAGAIR